MNRLVGDRSAAEWVDVECKLRTTEVKGEGCQAREANEPVGGDMIGEFSELELGLVYRERASEV